MYIYIYIYTYTHILQNAGSQKAGRWHCTRVRAWPEVLWEGHRALHGLAIYIYI